MKQTSKRKWQELAEALGGLTHNDRRRLASNRRALVHELVHHSVGLGTGVENAQELART
jgi:hypothetical protein